MNMTKRKTIEGWIDKAFNQLNVAKEQVKSGGGYSEAIQAAQQCVELCVKSILSLLDIHYSRSHEWAPDKKEFAAIAEQILQRGLLERLANQYLEDTIRLPRLLFLLNFWAQFYITAKYGFEAEHLAPAQALFEREEAGLAIRHGEECFGAATSLRFLDEEKLATLALSRTS